MEHHLCFIALGHSLVGQVKNFFAVPCNAYEHLNTHFNKNACIIR